MSTPVFNPIPFPRYPLTNISPFTYRDGYTFLQVLEELRKHINNVLVPGMDKNLADLTASFVEAMGELQSQYEAAIQEYIDAAEANVTNFEEFKTQLLADYAQQLDDLATQYATQMTNLTNQYDDFVGDIQALVNQINETTGGVGVQFVELTEDYTLEIPALWPRTYPIMYQFTQDSVGSWQVDLEGIDGAIHIGESPGSASYARVVPTDSANGWRIESATTFNVKDYGAMGDGVADDGVAIRRAFEHANQSGGTVIIPPGRYWVPVGSHETFPVNSTSFNHYAFQVLDNVTVLGHGATIVEDIDFANARITFFLNGSNITIDGITVENIYDMAGGSRPTNIPIGAGDAYSMSMSRGNMENIRILNCNFVRPWHPIKFGFTGDSGITLDGVLVQGCVSRGEPSANSSGGYNMVSHDEGRITNVSVVGNVCDDVTVSAAYGFVGVHYLTVSGNVGRQSGSSGAGIQLENGAKFASITGNTLRNHYNGIWLDDTCYASVSGNNISRDAGLSGTYGLRVSWQGYRSITTPRADGISFTGNTLNNCAVLCSTFGSPEPDPRVGELTFVGNVITLDGASANGINISWGNRINIANNTIVGASAYSIQISGRSGMQATICGNITQNIESTPDAVGINFPNMQNLPSPQVYGNRFANGLGSFNNSTRMSLGHVDIYEGELTEGVPVKAAPRGSIFMNRNTSAGASALWAKTGDFNTSWSLISD